MANFYKPTKKKVTNHSQELVIDSLDHHGRGVAKKNGKVIFVNGALPNEQVIATITADKKHHSEARCTKVISPSPEREKPHCQHYHQCGGCTLQHFNIDAQLHAKQQAVGALFKKFSALEHLPWQQAIESQPWHYRRSARVSVFDDKNQGVKVGLRQKGSKRIVNIESCPVLDKGYDKIFAFFQEQISQHKALRSVTHLQLVAAQNEHFVVIRHTKSIPESIKAALSQAATDYNWSLVFQGDAEQALPQASYKLEHDLTLAFGLDNFIQVNAEVNDKMLHQAMQWLALEDTHQVLDLFCGVGNFSLLAAKAAKRVVGIEGVASAVRYAQQNAQTNALDNCEFHCFDLTEPLHKAKWFDKSLDVLILDPSRMGAEAILAQLPLKQFTRVLYVSCDPVTLARDSKTILSAGFSLSKLGIMNMFPHTGHIETMALFERR
ncbi:23S rRNA (uracil(1939)-C(5))-methyltransferase RlmD [Pseudoalteromonas sp. SSDWG2]|uniref:23S rRNA (uracil(1939)-C(5))-methyltransferase RlmD n=1 Tax=Pseudoalteromonas sp. SSDWG2 TaxID=3139391 RepID=UPI003BAAF456